MMHVYRDGEHGNNIEARIQEAVKDFYCRYRVLPATVVVHPSEAEAARSALDALDLKVSLQTSGGCL
ncbi:MAG TPA: hypothetical protein G4O00_05690, partial [Thermoflexia bacterium]|nr:hypothetical protein [Thermoflexia bacterium]